MKKLMMVLCLSMGCCYGMNVGNTQNIDVDQIREDAANRIQNAIVTNDVPQNIKVEGMLEKEGLCWFKFSRFLQPIQVVVDASSLILSTTAAILTESKPTVSKDLIITTAITSAASGMLGIFLTKMSNRINSIDQQLGNNRQPSGLEDQIDPNENDVAQELANI